METGGGDREGKWKGATGEGDGQGSSREGSNRDWKRLALNIGEGDNGEGGNGEGKMGRGDMGRGKGERGGGGDWEKKRQEEGRFHRWI